MGHDIPKPTIDKPREKFTLAKLGHGLADAIRRADDWAWKVTEPEAYAAAKAEEKHIQFMHDNGHIRHTVIRNADSRDPDAKLELTTQWLKHDDSQR